MYEKIESEIIGTIKSEAIVIEAIVIEAIVIEAIVIEAIVIESIIESEIIEVHSIIFLRGFQASLSNLLKLL
jgi:hypothetical protein